MSKRKLTTLDAVTIGIVAIAISGLIWLCKDYFVQPAQSKDQCWYEIKYLHVSGREITKRVYMTCEGFRRWHWSERYNVPAFLIMFSDGNEVIIQGATDILSVAKIKEDEQ